MDPPRLAALAIDVADHPLAAGRLFAALGLNVATLDDSVELRLADGVVIRMTQTTTPSRVGLTFAARDLGEVAQALGDHKTPWEVIGPNMIRVERGSLTIDITELETSHVGLATVTMSVTDAVHASSQFWTSLGVGVMSAPAWPDDAQGAVDVWLKNCAIRLRDRAAAPATVVHMVLRSADPMSSTLGLDHAGWPYEIDSDSITTQTPDGCGVRITPLRR